MEKHYCSPSPKTSFTSACDVERIAAEVTLGGVSIIRTTVNTTRMDAGKVNAGFDLLTKPDTHPAPGLRTRRPAHPDHHQRQVARQTTIGTSEIPA
ncbi:hypothetical protein [Paenarthrobacter sp. YIM B13468]|uniref:hypothetical protein n=1 Tax=Paenarthrobacter sp. YIM B13468 TaxID=3366295 RepID=UPI00366B5F9F